MKNNDYFSAFILAGFAGLGCKMILSIDANSECENERKILDNIPIACAISGALLFSAVNLLPNIEAEASHSGPSAPEEED